MLCVCEPLSNSYRFHKRAYLSLLVVRDVAYVPTITTTLACAAADGGRAHPHQPALLDEEHD